MLALHFLIVREDLQVEQLTDVIRKAGTFSGRSPGSWHGGVEQSTVEASTRRLCDTTY